MPFNTLTFIALSFLVPLSLTANDERFPFPGEKPEGLNLHALVGADIQVSPNRRIEKGVILIRDGMIEKVEKGENTPPGYRKWDMSEKTIYAGFIDPYLLTGANAGKLLDLRHDHDHHRIPHLLGRHASQRRARKVVWLCEVNVIISHLSLIRACVIYDPHEFLHVKVQLFDLCG